MPTSKKKAQKADEIINLFSENENQSLNYILNVHSVQSERVLIRMAKCKQTSPV